MILLQNVKKYTNKDNVCNVEKVYNEFESFMITKFMDAIIHEFCFQCFELQETTNLFNRYLWEHGIDVTETNSMKFPNIFFMDDIFNVSITDTGSYKIGRGFFLTNPDSKYTAIYNKMLSKIDSNGLSKPFLSDWVEELDTSPVILINIGEFVEDSLLSYDLEMVGKSSKIVFSANENVEFFLKLFGEIMVSFINYQKCEAHGNEEVNKFKDENTRLDIISDDLYPMIKTLIGESVKMVYERILYYKNSARNIQVQIIQDLLQYMNCKMSIKKQSTNGEDEWVGLVYGQHVAYLDFDEDIWLSLLIDEVLSDDTDIHCRSGISPIVNLSFVDTEKSFEPAVMFAADPKMADFLSEYTLRQYNFRTILGGRYGS